MLPKQPGVTEFLKLRKKVKLRRKENLTILLLPGELKISELIKSSFPVVTLGCNYTHGNSQHDKISLTILILLKLDNSEIRSGHILPYVSEWALKLLLGIIT